jgi:hypothetical protein
MGERSYGSTTLDLSTIMEMNGQLQSPAALTSGKGPLVAIGQEPELGRCGEERILATPGI